MPIVFLNQIFVMSIGFKIPLYFNKNFVFIHPIAYIPQSEPCYGIGNDLCT